MSGTKQLFPGLSTCDSTSFAGDCFRVVNYDSLIGSDRRKSPNLLFDMGPKISQGGQRFSPPSDHRGLYVATDLVTAGAEYADGYKAWCKGDCPNHVTFKIQIRLDAVLDLTSSKVRKAIKMSKVKVMSAWQGYAVLNDGKWPITWKLGSEAFGSMRFDGIMFPSTKHQGGKCLLIFTERLVPTMSEVLVFDATGKKIMQKIP